jgi:hypothetical protein
MTDIETTKKLSYCILEELKKYLKDTLGQTYVVELCKSEKVYTLTTIDYSLIYSFEDRHFYLTFTVGLSGKQIATDIKNIMMILDHSEFSMMEDSYYDKDSQTVVFGMEAILSKQKDIILAAGKIKCPVCEKIYNKDQMADNGICKYCNLDKIRWN